MRRNLVLGLLLVIFGILCGGVSEVLAWDISTAVYASKSCSVTSQAINPLGFSFSSDGTKFYVVNHSTDTVYQYTLSSAWDVSTCSYANKSKAIGSQDAESYGITFKSDGTKMYITGDSNDRVFQYSLSTAWDVSTASYDSVSFSFSSQSNWVKGITFKTDGTKMYMTDWQTIGKKVWQYSLSTPWVVSSATYDSVNFSYASQVTQAGSTFFKSDGTKMYTIGLNNDTVFSYSLSSAWNVSTATYDSLSFSVTSQEVTPWDVFFSSDGSKMYVIGNGYDTVFQYTLTSDVTAPTITSASSDKVNGSYTTGEVIDIDISFSEVVSSTGSVTVTLETGDTDRTCTFTVSTAQTGTCNYTVQAGDTTSDLTINTISGTITDTNSNAMTNFVPTTNLAANKAIVIDTATPTVSSLVVTPGSTTASVSWSSNESTSSIVDYGLTSSYGTSTSEADTSPRVTSHTVSLSNLIACTSYYLRSRSRDAALNVGTSSDTTFTTTGCTGSATVSDQSSSSITTASGGSVSLGTNSSGVTLIIPSAFSGSDAVFQVKQLDKTLTLATTSSPSEYQAIGTHIYDFKSLSGVSTVVSSFNASITVSVTYLDADISGITESSLKIYRWDGATWNELTGCTVSSSTNVASCTTTNFSVFGLFGQATPVVASSGGGGLPVEAYNRPKAPQGGFAIESIDGESIPDTGFVRLRLRAGSDSVNMAISTSPEFLGVGQELFQAERVFLLCCGPGLYTIYAKFYTAFGQMSDVVSTQVEVIEQSPKLPTMPTSATPPTTKVAEKAKRRGAWVFTRDLKQGDFHSEVRLLQKYLNDLGYMVADLGVGSPGKETTFFGKRTKQALIRFQEDRKSVLLEPLGLHSGTGYFGAITRNYILHNQ